MELINERRGKTLKTLFNMQVEINEK